MSSAECRDHNRTRRLAGCWLLQFWGAASRRHWSREPPTASRGLEFGHADLRISVPGLQTRVRDVCHRRQEARMSRMPGRQSRQTAVAAGDGRCRRGVARKRQPAVVGRLRRGRCGLRVPRERALTGVNRTTLRVVIPARRAVCWRTNMSAAQPGAGKYEPMIRDPNPEPASPGFHSPMC